MGYTAKELAEMSNDDLDRIRKNYAEEIDNLGESINASHNAIGMMEKQMSHCENMRAAIADILEKRDQ